MRRKCGLDGCDLWAGVLPTWGAPRFVFATVNVTRVLKYWGLCTWVQT